MSYNFLDKSGLTYFWDKIKGIFLKLSGGTMTGQLKTSFKSSVATGCYGASATTISNLCTELRYSSGCMGSFSLNTAYTYGGVTIPTGWYNFLWVPHRSGGVNGEASGDNCDYGALMLWGMNNANGMFRIRYSNGSVQECRKITDNSMLGGYIANSNSYINTHPENSPVLIPFIHNDIAFLLKRGGSAKIYYDNVQQTLDISNAFDGSPSYWAINPTGTTEIIIELTLHQVFAWTNTIYCDFGSSGWRSKSVKIEVMNTNYASDVWTSKLNTTTNGSGNIKTTFNHTPVGASNAGGGFNKIRFTFSDWNNATIFRISQLGVYNYGSQGVRQTYMSRGIDDYVFRNITPNNNNTFNLGSSSNKWANVYATTFQGNATSATKATGDKNGADITTTYYKASNPNGYTSNTGTVTSVKIDATSPIAIDSNTAITTSGTRTISHSNSGVTAGKYRQVMVNATGHVTAGENPTTLLGYGITDAKIENGVITLGGNTITPVTDISGKQDKLTTQTAYTSKGSATKVPQITTNSLGQVTGITEVTITQPTVNNATLTIQKNGTNVQTFTANQATNATANITVPTKTSDLTNDSGFITNEHVTDVRINGTSILGNKVADIITNTAYNATTNKIATMADVGSGGGIGSSNDTIENIVSLTKAEYDALQTKETKTLYNITDDYDDNIPIAIPNNSFTINTGTLETNHSYKIGKAVNLNFAMRANTTAGQTLVLLTLPSGLYPTNSAVACFATVNGVLANSWIRNSSGEVCVGITSTLTNIEIKVMTTYIV